MKLASLINTCYANVIHIKRTASTLSRLLHDVRRKRTERILYFDFTIKQYQNEINMFLREKKNFSTDDRWYLYHLRSKEISKLYSCLISFFVAFDETLSRFI